MSVKTRTTTKTDNNIACFLNDVGIACIKSGRFGEGQQAFICALMNVAEHSEFDGELIAKINEAAVTVEQMKLNCDVFKEATPECDYPQEKKNPLYLYEIKESNKGLHIHKEALSISNTLECAGLRCATIMYNLGQLFAHSQNYESAKKCFEEAMSFFHQNGHKESSICIRLTPAVILHNLGFCCYQLGDKKVSMYFYKKAFNEVQNQQGSSNDLGLAVASNCLAVLYIHEDSPSNSEKAVEYLQQSFIIYRKKLGKCTKQVGAVLNNIGHANFILSDYDRAVDMYNEAFEIRRKINGYYSVDAAATLLNIGIASHQRRDVHKAMYCYMEYIALVMKEPSCSCDADIGIAFRKLAQLYTENGDYNHAMLLLKQCLKTEQTILGKSHPALVATLNEIGRICCNMQDFDNAMTYFSEALIVTKKCASTNESQRISALLNIAQVHKCSGRFHAALDCYDQVFKLQFRTYGSTSPTVASTLSDMGLMHYYAQEYVASLACFEDSLLINCLRHGQNDCDHLTIASTLSSIGHVFLKLQKLQYAENKFMESIEMYKKFQDIPEYSAIIANLMHNIAAIALEQGEEERAIQLYEECFRLLNKCTGPCHTERVMTLSHLASAYEQRANFGQALECLKQTLELAENSTILLDSSTITTSTNLGFISKIKYRIGKLNFYQGNVQAMMKLFTEAIRISSHEVEHDLNDFMVSVQRVYELKQATPSCASLA